MGPEEIEQQSHNGRIEIEVSNTGKQYCTCMMGFVNLESIFITPF